jgi:hypothetical protein
MGEHRHHPALLGLFRDVRTDEPKAVHRIALTSDGEKARIDYCKRALGPLKDCAIKLSADEDVELSLAIGEGIETTLAAMRLGLAPAWALGFADSIRSFPILVGIETLTILVDNDQPDRNGKRAGQDAAAECGRRWFDAGVEVRRIKPRNVNDFNDIVTSV